MYEGVQEKRGICNAMTALCSQCPKRPTCTKLCEEALRYANQDYVYQKHLLIGSPEPRRLEISESVYLTPKEKEIITLLGRGLSRAETSQVLVISRDSLRRHICNIRKKLHDFHLLVGGHIS